MTNKVSQRTRLCLALLILVSAACSNAQGADPQPKNEINDVVGRPVQIISIGIGGKTVAEMSEIVGRELAATGGDLVLLTEAWPATKEDADLVSPPVTEMAKLAKQHNSYIVTCFGRKEGDAYYNSAVLLGRDGEIVGVYDKVYPVMPNQLDGND